jgi:hypothetical protein
MVRLCACFSSLCVCCGSFKAPRLQQARMPAYTPGPETRSSAPAPHAKTRSLLRNARITPGLETRSLAPAPQAKNRSVSSRRKARMPVSTPGPETRSLVHAQHAKTRSR